MKSEAPATPSAGERHGRGNPVLTRRRFFQAALGGMAGTVAYTALVEPFWLEFVHHRLTLPRLPAELRGARLVQLSDLHISHVVSESYLRRSFARIAALQPDIVVYTGDFLTLGPDTHARLVRLFPHLPKGRLATLGILGNHDYGEAWSEPAWADAIVRLATEAGIRILRNEIAAMRGLQIAGLDDLWANRCEPAKTLRDLERGGAVLVLSHNPDSVDVGDWRGYDGWVLSGHTHGGQCKPPFLPAPLLPVRNRRYTAGIIPLNDGRTLYINRGLGYLRQVRFNVRPEVTVFTLA